MAHLIAEMLAVKSKTDVIKTLKRKNTLENLEQTARFNKQAKPGTSDADNGREIEFSLWDKFSNIKVNLKPILMLLYKCFKCRKYQGKSYLTKSE